MGDRTILGATMEIFMRPHRGHDAAASVAELVLLDNDTEYHLLTVSDFSREQSRRMINDIQNNEYRFVSRYVNGAHANDLETIVHRIEQENLKTFHLTHEKGKCWKFWGDIAGGQISFCFLIFDALLLFETMHRLKMSHVTIMKAFMSRLKLKPEPRISERMIYFRGAIPDEGLPLPAMFEQSNDEWVVPDLGVTLKLDGNNLEICNALKIA